MEGYEGCFVGEKALKILYGLLLNIFRLERVSSLIPKADAPNLSPYSKPNLHVR
jgi:hypothetical protein